MKGQIWETRPLESWAKAKELRAKWQESIDDGQKTVGQGNPYWVDWQVCFPSMRLIEDNPVGAMMAATNEAFARKARLACETRGWGREICGYQGNCWGCQFLGYNEDGSPFTRREFSEPLPCVCDQHAKRGQQVMDFENVPRWASDYTMYLGERDPARETAMTEHKVFFLLKILNDMERVFGQHFDEDLFREMIRQTETLNSVMYDVACSMSNIPAPISIKDMYSFFTLGGLTKVDPQETLDFWTMLRDEVQWRAKEKIASVGTERYRWIEAHPPSWHFLKYYRYMEQYGAVCVGSQYTTSVRGLSVNLLEKKPDGTVGPKPNLPFNPELKYPTDMPMKTREDAIRVIQGPDARGPVGMKQEEYVRPYGLVDFADFFHANGAVFALWRSGVGCTLTRKEQALRLSNAGIRVMHYEGSQCGDRTDLDEKRFLDQLDMWMESQGLEKFED